MGGKLRVFILGNAFLDMSSEAQAIGCHQPQSSESEEKTWL